MYWLKKILKIRPIDLKEKKVSSLREKAMMAQRNGDLKAYGKLSKEIEDLEDEMAELYNKETS